ncbi:hypothetical protein D0868_05737 [Hortaea werneckii]|uniref:Dihydroxy-acid/6-phosphogluconate dehydratase N-terminal domain-containing protein n=1 Tax=Hortaea werneckii TaxID=91943 RepID=A0A3M6YUX3_HORWE|nr:hypothetical protein D0868_05737 [Hortaea werneckii]
MNDYHQDKSVSEGMGLRQGLTSYGDPQISLFLRKLARIFFFANEYVLTGFDVNEKDTEEMIKAQPVDVVVAIGGCDETVPAQIMGSLSANKPVLPLVVGPMMTGSFRGQRIGACTDCGNNWAAYRAGELEIEDIAAINSELAPTAGTCGVMGTASTMACICAALGMMPLEGASAPAVSAARIRIAESTGSVAVSLATDCTRRPQMVLDRKSFINVIIVLQAIGGSTNAIVHLLAIANRYPQLAGTITLDTINEVGVQTPLLVDLKTER